MGTFERTKERKSRGSSSRRDTGRTFKESHNGRGRRDSSRERKSYGRDRDNFTRTKVTCSSCGVECSVPFKPTSNKPVYCDNCFGRKDKVSSDNPSNRDLDMINEKLNKIMKALDIR